MKVHVWYSIQLLPTDGNSDPPAQAPANAVLLWSVPPGLRPLAISLSVVATHLLGDVPSPPLLGLLQGWLKNWRCVMIARRDLTSQ